MGLSFFYEIGLSPHNVMWTEGVYTNKQRNIKILPVYICLTQYHRIITISIITGIVTQEAFTVETKHSSACG